MADISMRVDNKMPRQSRGQAARATPASLRLGYIDGLRGVAILAVVLYHAYARWPHVMPFGGAYAVPPLSVGWVGVELFFAISGFVILMTLERSQSLVLFAWQRWRRLFPAMLTATVLIVVTAPLFPERPQGAIGWLDPLSGLTFVDPKWWSLLLRLDVKPIEGVFWSLFVEVQFYAVAGLAYFVCGRRGALAAIAGVLVLSTVASSGLLPAESVLQRALFALTDRLGGLYYGWFIAGAALYLHTRTGPPAMLWLAMAGLTISIAMASPPGSWLVGKLALVSAAAIVLATLWWGPLQRHLEQPFWQFLGFISYPLYLVHENLLVALTVQIARAAPGVPAALLPLFGIAVAVAVAWLIARHAEPAVRRLLPASQAHAAPHGPTADAHLLRA